MKEEYRCIICGHNMFPTSEVVECSFCGKKEKADYICSKNHYVCDGCRLSTADELVKKTCKRTKEKDPIKIAELLMRHPAIQMHGPEHHYLTSCALLAAIRNQSLFKIDSSMIDKAVARAKRVPLGVCGSWGACGAAIGIGIALSIAMKVDMMSREKRGLIIRLVAEALRKISKLDGPRCCKASVIIALDVAKKFLGDKYGIKFPEKEKGCEFIEKNQDCIKEKCPFYNKVGCALA